MRAMEVMNEQALYGIFSNVEVLINCNKEMLKELEQVMSTQGGEGGDVHIGDVFTKLVGFPFFHILLRTVTVLVDTMGTGGLFQDVQSFLCQSTEFPLIRRPTDKKEPTIQEES